LVAGCGTWGTNDGSGQPGRVAGDSPEIQNILLASEARAAPVVIFWTKLDTGDAV
jgi:hypothetical protein